MAAEERADVPPATLPVNPDGIPDELKALNQFLNWDWLHRDGRWTKPPLRADGRGYARSTDPATWSSFEEALDAYHRREFAGVGCALTPDDPIAFLDLDHCRDPETGDISPWAKPILRNFRHTYHEVSPTGTGIKVLLKGTLPGSQHVKPIGGGRAKIELFDRGKYTTLTGHRCDGSPTTIADGQAALDALYAELFPADAEEITGPTVTAGMDDDDDRLTRARASRNGAAFSRLFDAGDTSGYGGDDSSADMALCNMLAFWFGPDPVRIDRAFRRSALMRPKWDKKHHGDGRTYGQGTVDAAVAGRSEFYTPRPSFRVFAGGRGDDRIPPPTGGDDDHRPEIDVGDQNLERISAKAWDALVAYNRPERLFRLGGLPVRIEGTEDDAPPITQPLDQDRLGHDLARAAVWFKETEKGTRSAAPPLRMIRDMLGGPSDQFPLPPLVRIVQTPVFAPDGALQTEPGYHPNGRTYYAPTRGFAVPAVSVTPSATDIATAKSLIIDDLMGEFPFVGDAERTNAVALFLDHYVRSLVDGPTPLRLIEAPTAGTGKGLLVEAIIRPAVGRQACAMPAANDDDEWRKRVTAQLRESPAVIWIDNVTNALDSGALSAALTATWWKDRRLGANENIRVPVRCVWVATANNPTMSTELARRTVRIRLDSKVDRPWRRSGFRHDDLRGWVDEHRPQLVWAALTLVSHWLAEGRPKGTARLGSYERWSDVLGGILGAAGIEDFLGNLEEFYETADLEGAIWRQFVALWSEKFGESEVGVAELFGVAANVEGFDFGKGGTERAQRISFGIELNKHRDRVIGDYRILNTRTVQRAKRWRLIKSRPGDNPFAAFYGAASEEDE